MTLRNIHYILDWEEAKSISRESHRTTRWIRIRQEGKTS